jgi:hypothetical protein
MLPTNSVWLSLVDLTVLMRIKQTVLGKGPVVFIRTMATAAHQHDGNRIVSPTRSTTGYTSNPSSICCLEVSRTSLRSSA